MFAVRYLYASVRMMPKSSHDDCWSTLKLSNSIKIVGQTDPLPLPVLIRLYVHAASSLVWKASISVVFKALRLKLVETCAVSEARSRLGAGSLPPGPRGAHAHGDALREGEEPLDRQALRHPGERGLEA